MKKIRPGALLPVSALALVVASGCTEVFPNSTISGRVADVDGQPVRDARVWTADGETRSSVNGAYTIRGSRADDVNVFAETTQDGVTFRGRNMVRAIPEEPQMSCNIVVFPVNTLARIRGSVQDFFGNPLVGARVFAYTEGYLTSASTVTDSNGNYTLTELGSGYDYTVQAGAPGYENDTGNITLSSGENRLVNFALDDRGNPTLPQVSGLSTTTWVSPRFLARGGQNPAPAYENIKRLWNPDRPLPTGRDTNAGSPIEVELNWNRLIGNDFYGYGIYRGLGNSTISDYDFYREPLSGTYVDGNPDLRPSQLYRYQITALGTGFPNAIGSEGPRSSVVEARTLSDLTSNVETIGTLRFSWNNNSGATSYVVYVFDRFPSVGVSSVFNNQSSPTTSSSLTYDRISNPNNLVLGRTYYYLVLGLANGNSSRTLSPVYSFLY